MSTASASGRVRWLQSDPETGNRWLRIVTTTKLGKIAQDYEVEEIKPGVFRLWRLDENYNLVCRCVDLRYPGHLRCDCEDAVYRRQGLCKHIRGLSAALDALPF